MSCKCKSNKHQCTYTGCTNHVIKGQHTNRHLGVCQEHFDNLFNDPYMQTEPAPRDQCGNCGTHIDPTDEEYFCDECIKEQSDILYSEEARYYGLPYKFQVWTDQNNEYGDVEVTCVNYSTVCFTHNNRTVPMKRAEFEKRFRFKDTTY